MIGDVNTRGPSGYSGGEPGQGADRSCRAIGAGTRGSISWPVVPRRPSALSARHGLVHVLIIAFNPLWDAIPSGPISENPPPLPTFVLSSYNSVIV